MVSLKWLVKGGMYIHSKLKVAGKGWLKMGNRQVDGNEDNLWRKGH